MKAQIQKNKVEGFCDNVIVFSFYALIFFLPISNALVEIFTALPIVFYFIKRGHLFYRDNKEQSIGKIWFVRLAKALAPKETPMNKPIWVWLIICFVSIFFSVNIGVSFVGFLGKALQSVFVYFSFVEVMGSKKRLQIFFLIFLFSGTIVSLAGLYQHFFGVDFIRQTPPAHGRISSSLREPTDFAAYLVIFLSIVLGMLLCKKIKGDKFIGILTGFPGKLELFLVFILGLMCLGFTFTRAGFVAFFLSVVIIGIFHRKVFIPLFVVGLVFIIIFSFKMIHERQHFNPENLMSPTGRMAYWNEAINMINDYPILGVGFNAYSLVGRDYKITWGGYPHNCYLQMAAEVGLIGLAAYLWIFAALYRYVWSAFKKIHAPFLYGLFLGAVAGLSGFLFHSFFDTFMYSVQLSNLMWVLLGLVMVIPMADNLQKN